MSAGSPVIRKLIEVRDDIDTSQPRPCYQDWCTTCGWDGSGEHILEPRTWLQTADDQREFLRDQGLEEIHCNPEEQPLYDESIGPQSYDQWWAEKGDIRSESKVRDSATAGNICCAVLLSLNLIKFGSPSNISIHKTSLLYLKLREWHMFTSCEGPPTLQGIPHHEPGSHPPNDTGSPESLAWAKARIEGCNSSHTCSSFLSPTSSLPSRLIDIGEEPETAGVVLRSTGNLSSKTQYTALSHCWGEIKPKCMTTSKNYDKHCENIPWADIPRTFREAIQFTQGLNIRYIWIDSVCIIQPEDGQDQGDWQRESVRMADYYYNAYVTLAAAFSVDCEGGLFSKRPERKHHLFNATIGGKYCRFFAFRKSEDISYSMSGSTKLSTSEWPLSRRGWAYQERLVSCRVLYFTRDQLIFDCFRDVNMEESSYYPRPDPIPLLKQSYWELLNNTADINNWEIIVQGYSALRLTKPGDRLPAMAAIAQQVLSRQGPEGKLGNVYLCGLLSGVLHVELLWRPYHDGVKRKQDLQCLAPSWSWASYPGSVYYAHAGYSYYWVQIDFVEDSLEFTASGRFGACTGGYITIKAPVIDCIWKVCVDGEGYLETDQILLLDPHPSPETRAITFRPDYRAGYQDFEGLDGGDEVEVRVILLYYINSPFDSSKYSGALVLYQSTKTKLYRRLGLVVRNDSKSGAQFPSYEFQTETDLTCQFAKAERRAIKME